MTEPRHEAKYRPEEVLEYLAGKGWIYRTEGMNHKVQECVFCGNQSFNFEVHTEKGMYKTWCCGQQGGFYGLKAHMGDADPNRKPPKQRKQQTQQQQQAPAGGGVQAFSPAAQPTKPPEGLTEAATALHAKLWTRPVVLNYLKSRGFNEDTLTHFKVGAQKLDGEFWVVIPHWMDGAVNNIKFRSTPPRKGEWRQQKGGRKVLFNADAIKLSHDEIILVEGELKAMALWQMGFKNVISLTAGVANFFPEWVDQLEPVKKIYLCLDSDKEGQANAEILANRLGLDRCFNIVLPDAKDPDEYFFQAGHTAEDFAFEMGRARQYNVRNVLSMDDAFCRLRDDMLGDVEQKEGLLSQWPDVNRVAKGLRPGELIILSAPPKIGKTTFALDWTLHLVNNQNVPGLFYCMEMSPQRLARKITCRVKLEDDDLITVDDVIETRYLMRGKPLYLPERVKAVDAEEIFTTIRAAYKRYGIKFVVFDNLHFLVRTDEGLREKLGVAVQGFKLLAEELRIPVILIVHPRKMKNNRVAMTSADLRDTAAIHADADMVIVLHRKRIRTDEEAAPGADDDDNESDNGIFEPQTQVIVDAARYAPGGKTMLYYEGAQSFFRSLTEEEKVHGFK